MTSLVSVTSLAVAGRPLFGNQWLALAVVGVGIAAFLFLVRALGQWLAATHPAAVAPAAPSRVATPAAASPGPEVIAAIIGAVADVLGTGARVAAVRPEAANLHAATPSVEVLMQQWSLEGRRQIYSSHKVR